MRAQAVNPGPLELRAGMHKHGAHGIQTHQMQDDTSQPDSSVAGDRSEDEGRPFYSSDDLQRALVGETRQQRDRRIIETPDDAVQPIGEYEFARENMAGPTTVRGGRGPRARKASVKKGTWVCPTCNIEDCEHKPKRKRGRPRLENRKDKTLRVYLPYDLREFLRRSKLQIADILEAVLDSAAMSCWRLHANFSAPRHYDDDGNEIKRSALDAKLETENRRTWRHFTFKSDTLGGLDWLSNLKPNIGPRVEERVTSELLERFRKIGKMAPQFRSIKYSDTQFCAYCIQYYRELLPLLQGDDIPMRRRTSSREEAKHIRGIAKECLHCRRS